MITILVRESYRPNGFKRTLDSILSQSFTQRRIIVSYDDERALNHIPEELEKIRVYKHDAQFFYDNYVNDLKSLVTDGYFIVLDVGDYFRSPDALQSLWSHLKGSNGVLCQMSRSGRIKPKKDLILNRRILRGKVGMPCLVLHHSFKDVTNLDGSKGGADYLWIKDVSRKVRLKFVPFVLVECGERDNGVMES